jgi:hypothetical protein
LTATCHLSTVNYFLILTLCAAVNISAGTAITLAGCGINTGTAFLEFTVFRQENFYSETCESKPDKYD